MIYLVYRWVLALFFLVTLVLSGLEYQGGARYLILLTHWNLLALICHLLWSAIFVTVRYLQVYVICRSRFGVHNKLARYRVHDKPVGCCGWQKDSTTWYQKVQWLLFTLGAEASLGGTILFWTIIYRGGVPSYISVVTHAINGITGFLDICLTGIPVRILHVVYPFIYCCAYSVFTGIYYAAGGTNHGNSYIYTVLNYEDSPGIAAAYVVGVTLVFCPLFHLLVWGMYLAREGMLYLVKHTCLKRCHTSESVLTDSDSHDQSPVKEMNEVSV